MKKALAAVLAAALLSGCGNTDETYRPEGYIDPAEPDESALYAEISKPAAGYAYASPAESVLPPAALDPAPEGELRRTFAADDETLSFTVENIFSGGEYYAVTASAARTDIKSEDTVYINGKLYTAPVLTLYRKWQKLGTFRLEIPDGDGFIALESAADNFSYGSEIISNIREFGAEEYPDVLGLVFRSSNTEAAVPEYARYFAVFEGKLTELAICENGSEADPRGAKLKPVSEGLAKQYLTVLKSSGTGYEVIKYEYRFDIENKRLNRQQVRFYGWDY